jgi:hypothetical protein
MNDVSLYAGLYEEIREFADLVDEVIIALKDDLSKKSTKTEKLGRQLASVDSAQSEGISELFINQTIQKKSGLTKTKIKQLGKTLLEKSATLENIAELEKLAISVEQERVSVMSRMRGREI